MKKVLMISTAVTMLSTSVFADGLLELGLTDPVVTPPASTSFNWDGPYVGLSYGRTNVGSTTVECFKILDKEPDNHIRPADCREPDVWEDYSITSVEVAGPSAKSDNYGAFVGYRWDLEPLVLGVEGGFNGDLKTLEAQAGLGLGRVLVYGFGGVADLNGTDGTVYGFGTDVAVTNRVVLGVKHTISDDLGLDSTTLRVALKF